MTGRNTWWLLAGFLSVLLLFSPAVLVLAQQASGSITGPVVLKGHTETITAVVFSPDGRWLASGCRDKTVRVWDVVSGREIRRFRGAKNDILGIAVSPDGRSLAAVSASEIIIWDTHGWQQTGYLETPEDFAGGCNVGFSGDGRSMAVVNIGATQLVRLDMKTGRARRLWHRQVGGGWCPGPVFSPDGKYLAALGVEGADREGIDPYELAMSATLNLLILTVDKGKEARVIEVQSGNPALAFSPDSLRVVVGDGGWIHVWDMTSGKKMASLNSGLQAVQAVAHSPVANWVVASGVGNVRILDMDANKQVRSLFRPLKSLH